MSVSDWHFYIRKELRITIFDIRKSFFCGNVFLSKIAVFTSNNCIPDIKEDYFTLKSKIHIFGIIVLIWLVKSACDKYKQCLVEEIWLIRTVYFLQGPPTDAPAVDTAEQVYISSLALLKVRIHMVPLSHTFTPHTCSHTAKYSLTAMVNFSWFGLCHGAVFTVSVLFC